MELFIIIVIISLLISLAAKGKRARQHRNATKPERRHMTQEETDELITVIIPTINNHK